MQTIKAVLFDLDGTLLDTTEFIYQAFEHTLVHHSHNMVERATMARLMGLSLEGIYKALVPLEDVAHLMETHRAFQIKNVEMAVAMPGAYETLTQLQQQGIKLGVVTSRPSPTSISTLKLNQLHDFFDVIVCGDQVTNIKPHPEPVEKALAVLGIQGAEAVMIGDTDVDIFAGRSAGTKTVGVTYGFYGNDIVSFSPDIVIGHLDELIPVLGL